MDFSFFSKFFSKKENTFTKSQQLVKAEQVEFNSGLTVQEYSDNNTDNWDGTYTIVESNSAGWESSTTTVEANSGAWGAGSVPKDWVQTNFVNVSGDTITGSLWVSGIILTTDGDSNNWNTTYTTVEANSASWSAGGDITDLESASGGWNNTRTTVEANSSLWIAGGDITDLESASGGWNNTRTTVESNSSLWIAGGDITDLESASGGWNNTRTTVEANSSQWALMTDITDLESASGGWNNTRTTVEANSSQWALMTDITDLESASGNWNTAFGWGNHATAGYELKTTVNTLTSNLQTQITNNDTDINNINSDIQYVSGQVDLKSDITLVDTLSSNLQTQISNNDTDISTLQGDITNIASTSGNWNTAFGWGNHATAGYATETLVDTLTSNLQTQITNNDTDILTLQGDVSNVASTSSNWDTAFGWGNHATAGYATETLVDTLTSDLQTQISNNDTDISNINSDIQYVSGQVDLKSDITLVDTLTSNLQTQITNNDTDILTHQGDITNIASTSSNWDTAFGWGNHATAGYATETLVDTLTSDLQTQISNNDTDILTHQGDITNIASTSGNWDTAFSWGNHATAGYATETLVDTLSSGLQTQITNNDTDISTHQGDITNIASVSGGWNNTRTTVEANSASWALMTDITDLEAASGNWNTAFGWGNHATAGYATETLVDTLSSGLQTQIINNDTDITTLQGDVTNIASTSGNWNTAFGWGNHATAGYELKTTVNTLTSNLQTQITNNDTDILTLQGNITNIANVSGGWNNTRTTVEANSGQWNNTKTTVQANSGQWNNTKTTVQANSGQWNNTKTVVQANSGQWNNTKTVVQANSSVWGSVTTNWVQTNFVNVTGDTITGSLWVSGIISTPLSNSTNWNTAYTHSQGDGSDHLDVANNTLDIINIASVSGGWNNTRTTVEANSSVWGTGSTDLTLIEAASSRWNNTTTTVEANSASWGTGSTDLTELEAASGGWNNTRTTVEANSASWGSGSTDLTELEAASGGWNNTRTTVEANSSSWSAWTINGTTLTPSTDIYTVTIPTLSGSNNTITVTNSAGLLQDTTASITTGVTGGSLLNFAQFTTASEPLTSNLIAGDMWFTVSSTVMLLKFWDGTYKYSATLTRE